MDWFPDLLLDTAERQQRDTLICFSRNNRNTVIWIRSRGRREMREREKDCNANVEFNAQQLNQCQSLVFLFIQIKPPSRNKQLMRQKALTCHRNLIQRLFTCLKPELHRIPRENNILTSLFKTSINILTWRRVTRVYSASQCHFLFQMFLVTLQQNCFL